MKLLVRKRDQTTLHQSWKKEEKETVGQQIARFFYTDTIPFSPVNNPKFQLIIGKITRYGIEL